MDILHLCDLFQALEYIGCGYPPYSIDDTHILILTGKRFSPFVSPEKAKLMDDNEKEQLFKQQRDYVKAIEDAIETMKYLLSKGLKMHVGGKDICLDNIYPHAISIPWEKDEFKLSIIEANGQVYEQPSFYFTELKEKFEQLTAQSKEPRYTFKFEMDSGQTGFYLCINDVFKVKLKKIDLNTKLDIVLKYLINHPNQDITRDVMKKNWSKSPTATSFDKNAERFDLIVSNKVFSEDILKAFFPKRKTDVICFRPTITDIELNELGIQNLTLDK